MELLPQNSCFKVKVSTGLLHYMLFTMSNLGKHY